MGWLIVTLIILVVSVILYHNYCDTSELWEFVGVMGGLMSTMTAVLLIVFMVIGTTEEQVFREQYNKTVELVQSSEIAPEAVAERVFDINDHIITHKIKSRKFMTKGLYSRETGQLPLLKVEYK